jgi:MHS family proline/betaine transporter-like MFS transporter
MNRKKLFFAGAIGNSIEIFEVLIYAFLQPYIVGTFFPPYYKENNLLFFITVILPFLAKPLGAIFFGVLGDLKGRKFVLELSIILSGISCSLIAVLPSYQTMGMFSFFCIVFLRFLLGFSLSGEYHNSFLYLAEHSEPRSRGFIVSWASLGTCMGILMATIASFSMMHLIDNNHLPIWSFRFLFILATLNLYIGFKARRTLAETPEFFISFPAFESNKLKAVITQAQNEMKSSLKKLCKVLFIFGFGAHMTYSLIFYAPFHLQDMNPNITTLKQCISLIIFYALICSFLIPLVGKLSDKIGRKFIFLVAIVLNTSLYLFFFFKLASHASYMQLLVFYFFVGIADAMYSTGIIEAMESLPENMRSTINGIFLGIPAMLFGALSLPYFESILRNLPLFPLFSLVIAIPLFVIIFSSKKKMFAPSYIYRYELEKAKIK